MVRFFFDRLYHIRRIGQCSVEFPQINRHPFGDEGRQDFGDGGVVIFSSATRGYCQMGGIFEDTANHSGARRIGTHFQKYSNPVAVGLIYGRCEIKPVQSLIKNGRCRFFAGQAIGPAKGTAVKTNSFRTVGWEKVQLPISISDRF